MLEDALRRIRQETDLEPGVGVVLGSGLGGLADMVEDPLEIPYGEIPGWPVSTSVGHAGGSHCPGHGRRLDPFTNLLPRRRIVQES